MSTSNKTNPITLIISLLSGSIFTIGLIVSGMVNPEKVLGFLRLFHGWDPSLGLVMGGGIAVAMPTFFYVKSRIAKGEKALNKGNFDLPTATKITPQLAIGSLMFGVGWGMLGFCPAPVLVTALAGYTESMIFVVAMLAGFWLHAKLIKN
ncbi:MAG TPA: hypothetical protein DCQ89_05720 [Psychrobacter sp.]|uniref:YeeE/YedE family protein n=1 Tax=Psychrobacter pasteurii TaxID=1945520 RepID=A0A1R4EG56_9GAMM|nr:DUF6691 family protein [Psychrobacter pasteurii]SJM37456.1 hypothetical protein A1019T_01428 [Psychrobacter pasteurii]HAO59829.1 hypothetical protein [Psychrobacter sp.]HJH08880.1 YeeE/YedE family protein [Psychrobacter pasteurii]